MATGKGTREYYQGSQNEGSTLDQLDCAPMGCGPTRQPSLLESMAETSQKLERIESKVDVLVGILFGNHAVGDDCREKEGNTNIEEEANKARVSANRLFDDLTNLIERLAD